MPVNILKIESAIYSVPLKRGKLHGSIEGKKPFVFIKCEYLKQVGIAEIYLGGYAPKVISEIIQIMSVVFARYTPGEIILMQRPRVLPFYDRDPCFRIVFSALQIACLDIEASTRRLPLWRLIKDVYGLANVDKIPSVYGSGGSVIMSPEEIANEVELLESINGISGYKIRAGKARSDIDYQRIDAACDFSGFVSVDLIMGTNPHEKDWVQIIELCKYLESRNIFWLEEPFYPDDFKYWTKLRSYLTLEGYNLMIAGGEAFSAVQDLSFMIEQNCLNLVQVDTCHTSGVEQLAKFVAKNLGSAGMASHVWGSEIAFLQNYHFARATGIPLVEFPLVSWNLPFVNMPGDTASRLKYLVQECESPNAMASHLNLEQAGSAGDKMGYSW